MSSDNRAQYVLGFMFDNLMQNVVLIRKNKPAWQEGKLNGVGGKVEPNEGFLLAMTREFYEETGVFTNSWRQVCELSSPDFRMWVYYAKSDEAYLSACTQTPEDQYAMKEYIYKFPVLPHAPDRLPNLRWLIPMCQSLESDMEHASYYNVIEQGSAGQYEFKGGRGGHEGTEDVKEIAA